MKIVKIVKRKPAWATKIRSWLFSAPKHRNSENSENPKIVKMIVFAGYAARAQQTKIKIGLDGATMINLKILVVISAFSLFSLFLSLKF